MKLFQNIYASPQIFDAKQLALYLVTDRKDHQSLLEFKNGIQSAIKGGVTAVQIREKKANFKEYVSIVSTIKPMLDENGIPLIINDDPLVAKATGCRWLHLGQNDCPVEVARQILGKEAIIGISVETLDQAYIALQQPVNYIAISPILASNSRPDLKNPWGFEKSKFLCSLSNISVVAIGGIKRHNAKQVLECGVRGICVTSDIIHQPNPQEAAQEFRSIINQHFSTEKTLEKIQ